MDVPTPYLINDTRRPELFKKTTFSNYLKKDVFQQGGNKNKKKYIPNFFPKTERTKKKKKEHKKTN